MTDTLKKDLESLTFNGNVALLPSEQLNDYATLKKVLTKACGKYKKNTFEFPYPAKVVVDKLLEGENIDFKKEFQFFATPESLADYMMTQIMWDKEEINVLEPSAGHGVLIDSFIKAAPDHVNYNIDAVELSELNYEVLSDKYGLSVNLFRCDFMNFEPGKLYDIIIANPPFSKNQDIDHIKKMFSLLAPGGRIITVASKSWTFGSQKKQKEFKEWLDENGFYSDFDHGTFINSGTNVSGTLCIIDK